MTRHHVRLLLIAVGLGLALLLTAVSISAGAPERDGPSASSTSSQAQRCCFTNPRFAGTCQVQPGRDETCSSILGYLNNPLSVGRTYCGSTSIRGGWRQAECR